MSACFALATISAKAEEVNSEATSEQIKTPQAEAANAEPTVNAQSLQQQEAANEAHSIVTIPILSSTADLYGGISINQSDLPSSVVEFQQRLEASLALWTEQGKRGIWLTIPMEQVELVPIAVKMGFSYHHANNGRLALTKWLPNTPSTLPANASHQVGVGICVVDSKDRILVVQERSGPAAARGKHFWKVPTGLLDHGEDIADAACREVLEETGIRVAFEGVVAFRQQHGVGVERKTDLFILCKARPLTEEIHIQESELAAAKWMPVKEYLELPLWPEGSAYWYLNRLSVESFLQGRDPGIRGPRLATVPLFRPLELPSGFSASAGAANPRPGRLFIYTGSPRL